jgi:hypothetical protein
MPQSGLGFANKPAWDAQFENFGIYVMKVIAVNWQDHTVDLLAENRAALMHVPIAMAWGGSDYGERHMPQLDPAIDPTLPFGDGNRETWAVVAFTRGSTLHPVVLGFVYPEVSQMMLEGYQKVIRHVGDTFQAVSLDGDIWLAFTPDGNHIGFHYDNPSPPVIHGTDYDRLANPATGKQPSFSAVLANGSTLHLDGQSGNVHHIASQHLHQEAKGQLDLLGRVVTIQGLPALYPAGNTAVTSAPSTDDATVAVAHLTTNAAWNYTPAVAGTGPEGQGVKRGWTYLTHAAASRAEIGLDGKIRTFKAGIGYVGDPIRWEEVVVTAPPAPYIVPPPVAFVLAWSLAPDQAISWLCPELSDGPLTFNRNEYANPSGVSDFTLNGATVPLPSVADPLDVVQGDVLKFALVGGATGDETLLTIEAIPATLPDVALWYTVDPTTDPPTVTPP